MIKQTENEVKAAVVKYLESSGYTVYRINNGGIARIRGNSIFYTFHGKKGFADLVAFNPKREPSIIFIETKKSGGEPTPEQCDFINIVNLCPGNLAICVDSLDRLIAYLE